MLSGPHHNLRGCHLLAYVIENKEGSKGNRLRSLFLIRRWAAVLHVYDIRVRRNSDVLRGENPQKLVIRRSMAETTFLKVSRGLRIASKIFRGSVCQLKFTDIYVSMTRGVITPLFAGNYSFTRKHWPGSVKGLLI